MIVQKNLVDYIVSKGFKYGAIADACGIESSAMSRSMNLERRLTLDEFGAICKFIGVQMDMFNMD